MLHHTTGLFSACNGITTTMTVFAICNTTPPDCSVRKMVSQPQWLCSQYVTPHHRTVQYNDITTTMTVFATCYTTPPDCSVRAMVSQPQWLCSQHVTPHHRTVQYNDITTTMTVFATCCTTPPDCSVRAMVSQPRWLCSQHVAPHHRTVQYNDITTTIRYFEVTQHVSRSSVLARHLAKLDEKEGPLTDSGKGWKQYQLRYISGLDQLPVVEQWITDKARWFVVTYLSPLRASKKHDHGTSIRHKEGEILIDAPLAHIL